MDLVVDTTLQDLDGARPPHADGAGARSLHRGPMRPSALTSTRRRMSGTALATRFRVLDAGVLIGLTLFALKRGGSGEMLTLPLKLALPPILGAVAVLWMLRLLDAYAFAPRERLAPHLAKTASAVAMGGLFALGLSALFSAPLELAEGWALAGGASLLGAHALQWRGVRGWRKAGRLTPNVVVVGATANASRLIEAALQARDAAILGVFDDRMSRIPDHIHGVPVLGDTKSLLSHKLLPFIDRIIITVTPTAQHRVRELIDRLKFLPNAVTLFMDVEGFDGQRSTLSQLADAPLTQVSGAREDDAKAATKRLQDLMLSGAGLLAATPLMALIALAIRLDSPGPVFFRQRRHGFNNEMIEVWKFRSMRHEAADHRAERQVSTNDDRVTRVGRVIRRLSLDELPQLFNVLKGEMSLVGPRPHAIGMKTQGEESARLVAEYAWRHRMKPGLTGWAQINGSIGAVDTAELVRRRVTLDVEYIERQSLRFDLYIILMTLPALIRSRNAVR